MLIFRKKILLYCIFQKFYAKFATMKNVEQSWQNGLSERHIAQIIRRKMITRAKPSGKIYDRKTEKIQ